MGGDGDGRGANARLAVASGSRPGPWYPLTIAVWSIWSVKRGAPARPFFVKIWITPFDASVPYSVAAAAPFRISMRSIDSGGMSSSLDGFPCGAKSVAVSAQNTGRKGRLDLRRDRSRAQGLRRTKSRAAV